MTDRTDDNLQSGKGQGEGDRWRSDPDTVERNDNTPAGIDQPTETDGGGISNRPIGEEIESQAAVPERGEKKPGAHAGHGEIGPDGEQQ